MSRILESVTLPLRSRGAPRPNCGTTVIVILAIFCLGGFPGCKENEAYNATGKIERKDAKPKSNSLLAYKYEDADGHSSQIWIWSYYGLKDRDSTLFSRIEAEENHRYVYNSGDSISFEKGQVMLNGKSCGGLNGNYVLSKDGLDNGFIRTFD